MMILFKPEHVDPILAGEKTQTRRLGKRRWNEGAVHQCKTNLFGDVFARVKIIQVRQERLGDISREDLVREGHATGEDYKAVWERIYKKPWDDELLVWVVDFEITEICGDCDRRIRECLVVDNNQPACEHFTKKRLYEYDQVF